MKKLIYFLICLIISVFLFVGVSGAVEWHTANQITVEWNAVTTVAAPDVLKYGVYTRMLPNAEPVLLNEQDTTAVTITFEAEGKYIIGVSTIRYVNQGTPEEQRLESEINWSDTNGESTPNPFGSSYYITPVGPKNLRIQ